MTCSFAKTLSCADDKAVQSTIATLKQAGFGIFAEIAGKEAFRKKPNADFPNSAPRSTPCISTGTS